MSRLFLNQLQEARNTLGFRHLVDREFNTKFFFESYNNFDLGEAVPFRKILLGMVWPKLQAIVFEYFAEDALNAEEVGIHGMLPIYHTVEGR